MAGEGLHEVGAEAVRDVLHFALGHAAVGVAEHELARIGFIDAQFHGGPGTVSLRPSGGDEQVRARELEAFEVHVRGLVAGHDGAAQHGLWIGDAHEGQEAQVVVDGGVQFLAESVCRLPAAERSGHGQIDDVLARPVDVDLHRGLGGTGAERHKAEQKQHLGKQAKWFHDAFQGVGVNGSGPCGGLSCRFFRKKVSRFEPRKTFACTRRL